MQNNNPTKRSNFKELIEKYSIEIPIIQRDYAQGRQDSESKRICEGFLQALFESLTKSSKLHLDFIYGSVKDNKFIPLDGQQRLTTLFLLSWYLGKFLKEDIRYLEKFTYQTRSSSKEFCCELVYCGYKEDFHNGMNLKKQIIDSAWFMPFYQQDPTISSMLNVLKKIHEKFKNVDLKTLQTCYANLENISFDILELDTFKLGEDLYIKMNARGKPLSDFENFKAKFESLLISYEQLDYKKKFAKRFDKAWQDTIWEFKNEFDKEPEFVGDMFLNYIEFVSKMLYLKDNEKLSENIQDIIFTKGLYEKQENLDFLYYALEYIKDIRKLGREIFSTHHTQDKVKIFSRKKDETIDFVRDILVERHEKLTLSEQTLIFMLIAYVIKHENKINESYLMDFIHVIRNVIESHDNFDTRAVTLNLNFGENNISKVLEFFMPIIAEQNIYEILEHKQSNIKGFKHEILKSQILKEHPNIKAKLKELEDKPYFKGKLDIILPNNAKDFNENHFNESIEFLCNLLEKEDQNTICICLKDIIKEGKLTGSFYGNKKYFYGYQGCFEFFLVSEVTENRKNAFNQLLNEYKNEGKNIQKLVARKKEEVIKWHENKRKEWRYYFFKYDVFKKMWDKDENLVVFYDMQKNYLEKIYVRRRSDVAKRINPYLKAICDKFNLAYEPYSQNEVKHPSIPNKIKAFYFDEKGLALELEESFELKESIIEDYQIETSETPMKYYLPYPKKDDSTDLIEKAIELLKDIKESE
ncbi:DUF262 domain-containing protein [Helicobacter cetorum]|uniref:GmrSD restriction endonucleases N-terminal domain-containing protein n=1 Tax=Helicobacter cetorum (strain ATCC BAA-429 / MIT 00-7128) TaxID=182217 RepID=I0EPT9_HELC0|nr:DUF262 domain-containing protein [Helicobacter cetorum]AFI04958.1 hypothetical protein HCW_08515 [Helicobacter cetorum MIT 00-7128]